ncbi:MAG: hypothetical protein IJJ44_03785 [Solobacterium sp.]|nr:hypothetical protein [Solobacterium sp.]
MEINSNTKMGEVLKAYPWLIEEAVKIDERLSILNSPITRAMIKNMTVTDLCKKAHIDEMQAIETVKQIIAGHEEAQNS